MVKNSLLTALLVFVVSACGSDGGGIPADAGLPDGRGGGAPDAGVYCPPVADFGDLGGIDGDILAMSDGSYLSIGRDLGTAGDIFVVELREGKRPFEDGITTGTWDMGFDGQSDYQTCGACVSAFTNRGGEQPGPLVIYIAQSGTLVVTSVEGNFTGSFTPTNETVFVGYVYNDDIDEYEQHGSCAINGIGASWDKAIP